MDQEVYQDELTLEDIFHIFRKRFWVFFVTFILTVAFVVIYLIYATPIYEASATLKIEPQSQGSITDLFSSQITSSRPDISTEVELIKSRSNIETVVDELNLVSYFKNTNPEITKNDVISIVSKMISISPVKDTKIVKISVQSPDPILATSIANKLAQVYNELLKSLSKNEYTVKRQFIESQIPKLESELKEAEDNLRKFKEENNVFVLDEEAKNILSLMLNYDSQINSYLLQKQENKATIEALNEMLKKVDEKIVSSETITTNPIVNQLKSQLVEYRIELAGLSNTYSENDPKIVELKQKISETEKILKDEVAKIVTSQVQSINPAYQELYTQLIESQYKAEVYDSIIESLKILRDTYQKKMSKLPLLEQKLLELERDIKVKESLYTLLLEKLEETKIAEAGVIGTANIIDKAIVPEKPVKPNKKLTLAIGGVLGIFLGILLVFVVEYADKSIKDEEEVKRIARGSVILGRVPRFELKKGQDKPELIVLNSPTSPQAESIKLVATNINYSITPEPKVIEITSPDPSEGKTLTAANLAISYAQNGIKTLLLDLDMRKPRVEKVLGLERFNIGIVNHILKDVPVERIIQNYMENLDVIPVGPIPPNPSSLLTSKKFVDLFNKLKEQYEKIIIDLPPVLAAADALIISKYTDGLVLVVRAGGTLKHSLKIALENIKTSSANLLGLVINDINEKSSNYYYYYYYYYEDGEKKKRRRKNRR
ncbi:polysaccharide biosynthesis tyrosine autokinase [Thermosipho sp. (in: thermotogales)]|jgi:capsular exopolysaccharide synthesis family protein|uniref:GumC family protein n=1 Tax=Thermosipho sp. (in: thermotogales) TaxID=1968895 RepID=UPI00257DF84E|nr:polysaccharide biosynthesis tyrosine autokinase [Thermosipho sp. (in: thermotogales)]MBZ4650002.1 capsular exopolysaccharide biosynthesis protein [Thermosipho sp. (in: thermotogales)]